jgi:hypothetical protein
MYYEYHDRSNPEAGENSVQQDAAGQNGSFSAAPSPEAPK